MTKPKLEQGVDYERGFIDGMQKQMQSSVDKAVNRMAQQMQEPVGKLQEPTTERSWFTIAELNEWADKNLAENPNWVMPTEEPERDEAPPQRTWVGLTDEEIGQGCKESWVTEQAWQSAVWWAEARLKEKNNG